MLGDDDFVVVIVLDVVVFGVVCVGVIDKVMVYLCGYGFFCDGVFKVFVFCCWFGCGYVVGLIVVVDDDEVIVVFLLYICEYEGCFLCFDIYFEIGEFVFFVVNSGLVVFDIVLIMLCGKWLVDFVIGEVYMLVIYLLIS